MAKSKNTTTTINAKRIQNIAYYDLSVGSLVNPNVRQHLKSNPIGLEVALTTLQELREEIEGYEISIDEIDCNRIFDGTELTETEVFIKSIHDHAYLRNEYDEIKQARELDKSFSREERQKIADELETEIKKEYRKIETVGKLNKTLRRSCEAKIEELGKQLREILSTLEVSTEESINNRLWSIAEYKLREIKNRLDYKITYLENIVEEMA
ncbi:MAG: hypothetical protein ACLSXJ_07995 [Clostridium saudiense]|uniref:hypothetical protein n=1 Tax=Clostridium saudiense TaxID=1414720 RepID=UPI0018AACF2B|nr:hypothetical protein [Clostridium saudiense]